MTNERPPTDNLFRDRHEDEDRELPVTSAELFFDLVFVFAVTQVSHFLLHHLDWVGAVEAAFLLLAVWSSWVDTVLITNVLDPNRQTVRVALFALMTIGLVFASALPAAFGDGGIVFAIAFVLFQFARTVFIVWATRLRPNYLRHFQRMAIWVAIYGAFWIAGGLVEGPMRFAFWAVALFLDYLSPALGYPIPGLGRSDLQLIDIEGGHFAERTNLFVMIAVGESVLVTGATFAELKWTPEVIAALAASLLSSMAMWSIYFSWSSDLAKSAIARANNPSRFIMRAFGYVPWVVVAGIVTTAVGDDLVLAEPLDSPAIATAAVLIGGPALFLAGALLFELGALDKWSRIRIAALVATVLLWLIVPYVSSLTLSAAASAILIATAGIEQFWVNRKRARLALAKTASEGSA